MSSLEIHLERVMCAAVGRFQHVAMALDQKFKKEHQILTQKLDIVATQH